MLFESTVAAGLLGACVQATSGGALYRRTTFLADSLGRQVFPITSTSREIRTCGQGQGSSAPFDDEGVITRARQVVEAGVTQAILQLPARKLGMKTTGHAGGAQNLHLSSRLTQAGDNPDEMIRKPAAACSSSS